MIRRIVLAAALVLAALPVGAVEPDEVLPDPAMEARAREISRDLRCLVCRNESIDESNAPLARDLRILVRERLVEGDSDAQVRAAIGLITRLEPKPGRSFVDVERDIVVPDVLVTQISRGPQARFRVQLNLINEMTISARALGATSVLGLIPENGPRWGRRVALDIDTMGPVLDIGGESSRCIRINLATKMH